MREMQELSPITYFDSEKSIRLNCYADTFVYHKASGSVRNLVAMRFGGYPEQVKAMADVLRKGAGIEAVIENHNIILRAQHEAYKRSITHDGVYAEGTMVALDDETGELQEKEQIEVDNSKAKRKMYIFCDEGDTDSLFAELDKKTTIPLIPAFKDYILEECLKRKILIPLEVLSASVRFDAYMLEIQNDEKEIEDIVNEGLKTGRIIIPNAVPGGGFKNIRTVSQYLNMYSITIANRIRNSFNPLFDPAVEQICERQKRINGYLKKNAGYTLYPAQLAVAESLKRRLDKAKVGMVVAECGALSYFIGAETVAGFGVQFQNGGADFLVFQRTRSRDMVEMLVIGAAANAKDMAEEIDVVLKPQGMDSIQPLFECGVSMAIAFFNMRFSSSRTALRFCSSLICLAVMTISSSILISEYCFTQRLMAEREMPNSSASWDWVLPC